VVVTVAQVVAKTAYLGAVQVVLEAILVMVDAALHNNVVLPMALLLVRVAEAAVLAVKVVVLVVLAYLAKAQMARLERAAVQTVNPVLVVQEPVMAAVRVIAPPAAERFVFFGPAVQEHSQVQMLEHHK